MEKSRKRAFFGRILPALLLAALLALGGTCASAAGHADTWTQVRDLFAEAGRTGESRLSFMLSGTLLREVKADNSLMWYWGARGGAGNFSWTWNSLGQINVEKLEWYDCPWRVVSGETEMAAALEEMRTLKAERFVLLAGDALYDTLKNDAKARKEAFLAGGIKKFDTVYSHDGSRSLEYVGCRYWDGGFARVSSEQELLEAVERLGALGYDALALSVDSRTWAKLKQNDWERLHTLEALGCLDGGMSWSDEEQMLYFEREGGSPFYPGYRILRAVSSWTEDRLPARLLETLEEARRLVAGVDGTDREKALAIHDLLCARVTYTIDESTDEDDCCVGAILNGKANCDGYADAFYLLCGLKGVSVRLWHGDDLNYDDPLDDATHLWNLLLLDGTWRSVDVTWDDDDDGAVSWVFYNIGTDRMSGHYTYIADLLPQNTLAVTDLMDRPAPEFEVSDAAGAVEAVKKAGTLRAPGLVLWMTEGLFREYRSEANPVWKWLDLGGAAECDVTYYERDRRVQIRVGSWSEGGTSAAEVETEQELLAQLRAAADSGAGEISLYLGKALYERYKQADNPIWMWLDKAGIREAKVNHSDESRNVTVSQIVYADSSLVVAEAETEQELIARLRAAAEAGAKEVRLYLGEGLYARYKQADNPIWKWLDMAGIGDAKVTYNDRSRNVAVAGIVRAGGVVKVGEAETERELIALLRAAAEAGAKEAHLYLGESLYARYKQADNPIWKWLDLAGIRDAKVMYSDNKRNVTVSGIVRSDDSVAVAEVETEEELLAFLRSAAGNRAAEIRAYLGRHLYERYRTENSLIWKWLDLAGIGDADVYHNDESARVVLKNPVYNGDSVSVWEAETETELITALRRAASSGAGEIRLYLGEALYARFDRDGSVVWDWLGRAGISDARVQYSGQARRIVVSGWSR